MNDRRRLVAGALILLAAFLAYGRTMRNGFVNYDDPTVIVSNTVTDAFSLENARAVFTEVRDFAYLPFYYASFWIDAALWQKSPRGIHGFSLVLHAINALLVFLLLSRLVRSTWPAFFAALLFAVHPSLVESVAWASGRKDVLSMLFFLLGVLAFDKGLTNGRSRDLLVLPAVAFVLALFTKATVIAYPAILWGLMLLRRRDDPRWSERARPVRNALLVLAAIDLAAIAVHVVVARSQGTIDMGGGPTTIGRAVDMLGAFGSYVRHLVFPTGLSVHYDVVMDGRFGLAEAHGLVLLSCALLILSFTMRRWPLVWFAVLWFLVSLVPFNNIVPRSSVAMADRYLYIPAVGFFLLPALALNAVHGTKGRCIAMALLIAASIAAAGKTWFRVGVWHSSESLWRNAIEISPESTLPRLQLGHALEEAAVDRSPREARAAIEEAVQHYRSGERLARDDREAVQARLKLVGALVVGGEYDEALMVFERLDADIAAGRARLEQADLDALSITRSSALLAKLRYADARLLLERISEASPRSPEALDVLAASWVLEGRQMIVSGEGAESTAEGRRLVERGIAIYERLAAEHEDRKKSRIDLARAIAFADWLPDQPIRLANEVGRIWRRWPADPAARALRASINLTDDPAGAAADLDYAIRKDPYREEYYIQLSDLLRRLGKNRDATAILMVGIAKLPDSPRLVPALAQTYLSFAYHHQNTKNPELALEAAERAVGLEPSLRDAHELLGELHEYFATRPEGDATVKQTHWEKARASFETALELDSKSARARIGLARYYKAAGYGAGFEAARVKADAKTASGSSDWHKKQFDYFKKALQYAPEAEDTKVVRDWFDQYGRAAHESADRRLAERDPDAARVDVMKALEYEPLKASHHTLLGRVEFELGRYREAEAAHARAVELDPESLESLYELGKLQCAASNWAVAKQTLGTFIEKATRTGNAELLEVPLKMAESLVERCKARLEESK